MKFDILGQSSAKKKKKQLTKIKIFRLFYKFLNFLSNKSLKKSQITLFQKRYCKGYLNNIQALIKRAYLFLSSTNATTSRSF